LEWLAKENPKESDIFCDYAIRYNNLELLKIFRQQKYKWGFMCCFYACKNNNLEMLRFLRESENKPCPWTDNCYEEAFKNNNVEMLEYLLKGNDKQCPGYFLQLIMSVTNNNINKFKFFRSLDFPKLYKNTKYYYLEECKDPEFIKLIKEQ